MNDETIIEKLEDEGILDVFRRVKLDEKNFPDENLRDYIRKSIGTQKKYLTAKEVASIKKIDLNKTGKDITSLRGIEHFENLEVLIATNNITKTSIKEIDVSKNVNLKKLDISRSYISNLDLTNNKSLEELHCFFCDLKQLDLSHNPELKTLCCSNNGLTTLNLSENKKIVNLECDYNKLMKLDLTNNVKLERLDCSQNYISELNVSNIPGLTELKVNHIKFDKEIDLSANSKLKVFECGDTYITKYLSEFISKNKELIDHLDIFEHDLKENETEPIWMDDKARLSEVVTETTSGLVGYTWVFEDNFMGYLRNDISGEKFFEYNTEIYQNVDCPVYHAFNGEWMDNLKVFRGGEAEFRAFSEYQMEQYLAEQSLNELTEIYDESYELKTESLEDKEQENNIGKNDEEKRTNDKDKKSIKERIKLASEVKKLEDRINDKIHEKEAVIDK